MNTTVESRRKALRDTIDRAGGVTSFRKALGVTHQGVYYWLKVGHVPVDKALEIEDKYGTPRLDILEPRVAAAFTTPTAADLL